MPSLTKTQIEHAMKRLQEQRTRYIDKQLAKLGDEPECPELDNHQKLTMIRSGKAVLSARNIMYYCNVVDAFEYPLSPIQQEAKAAYDKWREQHDQIVAKADALYESVVDDLIMSPDGKAALERIAAAFA